MNEINGMEQAVVEVANDTGHEVVNAANNGITAKGMAVGFGLGAFVTATVLAAGYLVRKRLAKKEQSKHYVTCTAGEEVQDDYIEEE